MNLQANRGLKMSLLHSRRGKSGKCCHAHGTCDKGCCKNDCDGTELLHDDFPFKTDCFLFLESSWNPHKVNDPHGTYQYRDHRTVLPQGPEEHRTEDPSPE